jgi:putative addiction module CopG family antidote
MENGEWGNKSTFFHFPFYLFHFPMTAIRHCQCRPNGIIFASVKTEALNVNLTAELRRYVMEQVLAGLYQDEHEVVRDALRQMQRHELEPCERLFGDYPGAPQGEPTAADDEAIRTSIDRHRAAKRAKQAA